MPSPTLVLGAFDTVVSVAGLILGIVGLAGPDPLETRLDDISADLDRIDDRLDDLRDSVNDLGQDIIAEFDRLTRRDIAAARAQVETAAEELTDFQRKENPTGADREQLSNLADEALNGMLAQFEEVNAVIPAEIAAVMVNAINYAITVRLKVAIAAEDGAFGKDSIKDGLLDAANALERIEDGFFASLSDRIDTTASDQIGARNVFQSFTGSQVAQAVPFPFSVAFLANPDTVYRADELLRFAANNPQVDAQQMFRALGTSLEQASQQQRFFQLTGVSQITGDSVTVDFIRTVIYPSDIKISDGFNAALQSVTDMLVARDMAALT